MEQLPDDSDAAESNSLAMVADSISAFIGKVPASLQRNVVKAIGHLLRIPMAHNDTRANEIKAISEARVKIIKATGNKLAQAVEIDSSLAQLATQTHASKILRQQKNAIGVLRYAVAEIDRMPPEDRMEPTISSNSDQAERQEISDDWLNAFESEAVNMSSEQMRMLFGKMLAGEIKQPSAFSIRTIKLMGQMDTDVAETFQKFCSMTCSLQLGDGAVVIQGAVITLSKRGASALYGFDVPKSKVLALEEYGLIASSIPTEDPYFFAVFCEEDKAVKLALTYLNKKHVLIPKHPKTAKDFAAYGLHGMGLSRVGRELLKVVELQENHDYTKALTSFLDRDGLTLYELAEDEVDT